MKICHILAGNEEGGLENHVVTLCNALAETYEIHLIAHEKYRERMDTGVHFHALDLTKGRRNLHILWKLYRLIKKVDAKIIHAHANKAAAMVGTIKPLLSQDIRTIASVHSEKRNVKAFKRFDHLIGVSHRVLEPLEFMAHTVVYNGIDLPPFAHEQKSCREEFSIEEDTFVLCAIGRMEAVKNFSMLLEAVVSLDVVLLLVGEGSMMGALKEKSEELGISHKVHFTGFRKDVVSLLRCADLCVISSDREGFPYVLVESLLLERPVISTDVSDMQYILPSEAVVERGNVSALRDAIKDIKQGYEVKIKRYHDTFLFAKRHFSKNMMINKIKAVYEKVVRD